MASVEGKGVGGCVRWSVAPARTCGGCVGEDEGVFLGDVQDDGWDGQSTCFGAVLQAGALWRW